MCALGILLRPAVFEMLIPVTTVITMEIAVTIGIRTTGNYNNFRLNVNALPVFMTTRPWRLKILLLFYVPSYFFNVCFYIFCTICKKQLNNKQTRRNIGCMTRNLDWKSHPAAVTRIIIMKILKLIITLNFVSM